MNITISDTNECLSSNGECAHNCSNTDGSFVCSCVSGYELDTDGMACNGTSTYTVSLIHMCFFLEQTLMSVQSTAVAVSSSVPMKLEAFSVVAALGMS